MVARAVGLVAGTKAVGPTPSAGAATRGEVPARPDRAHTEVTSGVGWARYGASSSPGGATHLLATSKAVPKPSQPPP